MTRFLLLILFFILIPHGNASVSFSINMYKDDESLSEAVSFEDGQFRGMFLMDPHGDICDGDYGQLYGSFGMWADGPASEATSFRGLYGWERSWISSGDGTVGSRSVITDHSVFSCFGYIAKK